MMKLSSNNDELRNISSISSDMLKKTFNKITVQSILNENRSSVLNVGHSNKPNTIIRKIKDFGMIGSVNNATGITLSVINSRKCPLQEAKSNCDTIETKHPIETTCPSNSITHKKIKLTKEEKAALRESRKSTKENSLSFTKVENSTKDLRNILKRQSSHGRKVLSLPQAVARRNARERNRVKQVNNGFAALRERIPDEVATAFETNNSCRSSGKKFSKVETLRMAVEYIKSLERLLGIDLPSENGTNPSQTQTQTQSQTQSQSQSQFQYQSHSSSEDSFILIKDEFDVLSPFANEILDDAFIQCDADLYLYNDKTTISDDQIQMASNAQHADTLNNMTVSNGLQYIRIPGTNSFQLLRLDNFTNGPYSTKTSNLDEESQIIKVLIDTNSMNTTSTTTVSSALASISTNELLNPSSTTINMISRMNDIRATSNTSIIVTAALEATEDKQMNEVTSTPSFNLLISSMSRTQPVEMSATLSALITKTATSLPSLSLQTNTTTSFHQPITTTTIIRRPSSELSPAANEQVDLKRTCARNQQLSQQQQQQQQQKQQQQNIIHTEATTYIKSHMINRKIYKDITITKANMNLSHEMSITEKQSHQAPQYLMNEQKQFMQSVSMSSLLDKQSAIVNTTENATCSSSNLSTFYNDDALENDQEFYTEDLTLKKEFESVMLDSADANVMLTDENLIDWWQTHTHKSDDTNLV